QYSDRLLRPPRSPLFPYSTLFRSYGHGFSVRDVLGAVERAAGHGFEVRQAPRRAGDPASIVSNPALIKKTLGWEPVYEDLNTIRSEEHTSELQSRENLVCRLLLEK